jgi:site-specific recombinase XerD
LSPHIDELIKDGYTSETIRERMRLIASFSSWLRVKGLTAADVNTARTMEFLQQRKRRHRHSSGPALRRLLLMLEQTGVISEESEQAPTPAGVLTHEFSSYLERERALARRSIVMYKMWARRFLTDQFGDEQVDCACLRSVVVIDFVQRQTSAIGLKACKLMTSALRSFFQFLRYQGYTELNLAAAVPAVASWTMTTIPKALPSDQVEQLLGATKRDTAVGRRDYAIILLMARLGLRAGEVAHLALDDVDWHSGCITILGKGGHLGQLPLPPDVGEALADYLKNGRPKSSDRSLFLSVNAPIHGFSCNRRISMLVKEALERAGIDSPRKGAHQLRHALATGMLQRGASLGEIGEVLRHRSLQSTALYAKVDLVALRDVAMPWPGGAR